MVLLLLLDLPGAYDERISDTKLRVEQDEMIHYRGINNRGWCVRKGLRVEIKNISKNEV
jgi:hypothetical protein